MKLIKVFASQGVRIVGGSIRFLRRRSTACIKWYPKVFAKGKTISRLRGKALSTGHVEEYVYSKLSCPTACYMKYIAIHAHA